MRPRGDPVHSPPVRPVESEPPAAASAATTELPVAAPTMVLPPSSSTPTPTPVTENGQDDAAAEWKGSLQSFVVGDPGNASKVRALPDATEWNHRDTVLDGVTLIGRPDGPIRSSRLRAASVRGLAPTGTTGPSARTTTPTAARTTAGFSFCASSQMGCPAARLSHKAAVTWVTRQGCEPVQRAAGAGPPKSIDWASGPQRVCRGAVILDFGARLLQENRGNPGERGGGDAPRGAPPDGGDRGLRDRDPCPSGQ